MMAKPVSSSLKVRGVLYAAIRGWIRENYSDERYLDFLQGLPKDLHDRMVMFEFDEWYPAGDVYPVYEQFIEYFEGELQESELISRIVEYMFEKSVKGFLRKLVAFLTPPTLIKRATSFWQQVHSQGNIGIEKIAHQHYLVSLHDWKIHRISCLIFEGWMRQLLSVAGGISILTEKVSCSLKGDDACKWEVIYE